MNARSFEDSVGVVQLPKRQASDGVLKRRQFSTTLFEVDFPDDSTFSFIAS